MSTLKQSLPTAESTIDVESILARFRASREGKRKLVGTRRSKLCVVLNATSYSLSARLEELFRLAEHEEATHKLREEMKLQRDDLIHELKLCVDLASFALDRVREDVDVT